MSIRPHPTKEGTFIIDCRPGGYKSKRVRLEHKGTKESAEKIQALLLRKQPTIKQPDYITTAGIFKQWIIFYTHNRAKRTAEDARDCWKQLALHFGKIQPKSFTQSLVESYKTKLSKTHKPRTIHKHLTYLSSMLKWAVKNGLCEPLPIKIEGFEKKYTRAPKPRPITQEQITDIYSAIEERYRLAFLLMADAGLRRNEALHLKGSDVELEHGLIFVVGKGNKEGVIPITTKRLRIELEKRLDKSGYLTINPSTKKPYFSIRKALLRAAEKVGIKKNVSHHLLRHSFGTNATIAGMDLKAIQQIMRHSSPDTTQIYQHLAGDYLIGESKKLQNAVHMDKNKKL